MEFVGRNGRTKDYRKEKPEVSESGALTASSRVNFQKGGDNEDSIEITNRD